jgi:hypothetical protein
MTTRQSKIPLRYLGVFASDKIPEDTVVTEVSHIIGRVTYFKCWAEA